MKRLLLPLMLVLLAAAGARADAPYYIFYFIGDGMGHGHVMAAQNYLRAVSGVSDTTLNMLRMPVVSLQTTYSHSNPVTDSAAAGTALATGRKTDNGMLGMTPDSVAVSSIAKQLKLKGYGIGLVTTVAADDATPAAFYASVPNRSMYYQIGRQAAESGFDFIAGAGLRGYSDKQGNPTGLQSYLDRMAYKTVHGSDELAATDARKIILLGSDTISNYRTGYAIELQPGQMDITDMTAAAISHLKRVEPASFFLMVEGGAIDHAGHANDAGGVIGDVLAFDRALGLALDFQKADPEHTLIVVTADHETGGMALGNTPMGYMTDTALLQNQRVTKDTYSNYCNTLVNPGWERIKGELERDFGFGTAIELTPAQWQRLEQAYDDTFVTGKAEKEKALYNRFNHFAGEVFRVLDEHTGIGWTSIHHTGNPVPVFAIGVGSERFAGVHDNTDIPAIIMELANTMSDAPVLMR